MSEPLGVGNTTEPQPGISTAVANENEAGRQEINSAANLQQAPKPPEIVRPEPVQTAGANGAGPKPQADAATTQQNPDPKVAVKLQLPSQSGSSDISQAAAHPEYYSKIDLVGDDRLDFTRAAGSVPPPANYRDLRRQIDEVARLVRLLFQDDKVRRRRFFEELHLTADSGLRGPNSDLDIGLDNLQDVKNNIADEFPAVRGKIWWWNFGILVGAVAICLVGMWIYHSVTNSWIPAASASSKSPSIWLAAFLIPLGAAIGLFVEFVFRVNDDVPYDQLRAINPGRWKPFQRAFNTVVVGYIFAGMLGIGAVQVGVASVLLNDFMGDKPTLSLVVGFVTGFAFPYVRDLVQQFRPVKRAG